MCFEIKYVKFILQPALHTVLDMPSKSGNRNLFQDLKQYAPLLAHAETYLCMYMMCLPKYTFGKCLS